MLPKNYKTALRIQKLRTDLERYEQMPGVEIIKKEIREKIAKLEKSMK